MANYHLARNQEVAYIAGQILNARLSEHKTQLRSKLAHARRKLFNLHPRDTFEQERLEVLEGAVECLESPAIERVRAGMDVLEQLAYGDGAPIIRLSRPA